LLAAWSARRHRAGYDQLPGRAHPPLIEKPTLTQHGDTATLRFWVLYPPNMQDPARLTLTAKKGAPLHTESANWHEVAGLAPAASPSHPLEGQAPSLFGKP